MAQARPVIADERRIAAEGGQQRYQQCGRWRGANLRDHVAEVDRREQPVERV